MIVNFYWALGYEVTQSDTKVYKVLEVSQNLDPTPLNPTPFEPHILLTSTPNPKP